jgi:hypothetical protein
MPLHLHVDRDKKIMFDQVSILAGNKIKPSHEYKAVRLLKFGFSKFLRNLIVINTWTLTVNCTHIIGRVSESSARISLNLHIRKNFILTVIFHQEPNTLLGHSLTGCLLTGQNLVPVNWTPVNQTKGFFVRLYYRHLCIYIDIYGTR